MTICRIFLASMLLLLAAPAPAGSPDDAVDGNKRAALVVQIGELMQAHYVFPDMAATTAQDLQQRLAAGEFSEAEDAEAIAELLTEAIQATTKDKHIRVRARDGEQAGGERPHPLRAEADRRRQSAAWNYAFARVEHLDDNIGYLDLRGFSGAPGARETAAAAMAFLAHSDALIFDLRQNGGGDPDMVRYLSSWLFSKPTHLNSLYWREGDQTREFWTLDDIPGTRMAGVPVFVLTSDYTFSGGEEFAYNIQTQKRGTIVGETTGGGANPGRGFPLDGGFDIFIPTGRAINPVTGDNWEGRGVIPDVAVPADRALERAVGLATPKATAYREQRLEGLQAAWENFVSAEERVLAGEAGADAELLGALEVLQLRDEVMAADINAAADNLAQTGHAALAGKLYQRALALDPDNEHARERLAGLE